MFPNDSINILAAIRLVSSIPRVYKMRESIAATERLVATLRYCVTGDARTTTAASYRVSRSTVCRIITEMCYAIWTALIRAGF